MQKYLRIHTVEKPYFCVLYQKGISVKWAMQIPLRVHTGVPYTCEHCQKAYSEKKN